MEQFDITLNGQSYLIAPQENGTYRIMNGEEKIGVVYAEPAEEGTEWRTLDDLEDGFVSEAGKLIAGHHSS